MGIMIFMLKSHRRAFGWPNNLRARLYYSYITQKCMVIPCFHYSPQPSAPVNNVIYSTRFARGVNRITTHFFVF